MAFAVEGDGVGFATESYAASALYTTLASLSGALWRIRRASAFRETEGAGMPVLFEGSDDSLQSRFGAPHLQDLFARR